MVVGEMQQNATIILGNKILVQSKKQRILHLQHNMDTIPLFRYSGFASHSNMLSPTTILRIITESTVVLNLLLH